MEYSIIKNMQSQKDNWDDLLEQVALAEMSRLGWPKREPQKSSYLGRRLACTQTLVTFAIFSAPVCQQHAVSMASFAVGALFEVQAGGDPIRLRALACWQAFLNFN